MPLSDAAHTAFDTWPQWRLALDCAPTIIRRLPGGLTNQHYLLKANGLRVVMRINNPDAARLGIDRQREQKILEQINGKAFAPAVFYCEPEQGVLVTEYVEGTQWQADSLDDPAKIDRLLELIAQIHAVSTDIPTFDYSAHVRNYWQRLLDSDQPFPMSAQRLYRSIESRLPAFQAAIQQPVLCHHDLTPANIIENADGELTVLDWEYAGAGLPLIEAIGVSRYWQNVAFSERILEHDEENEALELAGDIVDFYELAWRHLR
ncbi:MAG: phosphotransferase family protein [Gammaproteobacteria bacterium]|nr:phosphotransferase family protein [Gammaproteobacteria bacterium]MBQ0840653.1 phosphotransferase family protein [Gammaproteobacteria bacterium]